MVFLIMLFLSFRKRKWVLKAKFFNVFVENFLVKLHTKNSLQIDYIAKTYLVHKKIHKRQILRIF